MVDYQPIFSALVNSIRARVIAKSRPGFVYLIPSGFVYLMCDAINNPRGNITIAVALLSAAKAF